MDGKDLSALVRRRREQLGWSQTELALAMGSSPSRINKLEANAPSVSPALMLRALDVMATSVRIEIASGQDPFVDPSLSDQTRAALSGRLLRLRRAAHIARRHEVDAGDVEHVLYNLTLSPLERLRDSFRRARLKQHAVHRR